MGRIGVAVQDIRTLEGRTIQKGTEFTVEDESGHNGSLRSKNLMPKLYRLRVSAIRGYRGDKWTAFGKNSSNRAYAGQ